MNFYFLRHFLTEIDPSTPVSEWKLSKKGKTDQELFIQSLGKIPVKKVYTSPEKKALTTAETIASNYDLPIVILDSLKEVNRGLMGYSKNDYKKIVRDYFDGNQAKEVTWESKENLQKRINTFISILKNEESSAIIIGHGIFLTILLGPIFKKNYFEFWSTLKFGEIVRVTKEQLISII